jgi:KDO2-lipid IV(A) lauroyltransferase
MMKNKIEYILFLLFSKIFQVLGLNLSRKLSPILAGLFYYFIPIRKATVIENLRNAFPDYSENEIRKIAFGNYKSFAITLMEISCLPSTSKSEIEKKVNCKNLDLIINRYNENNGVILLGAHFGNWEYMAASMGVQLNIPLAVVVKTQRNPYVTNWMNRERTKWNNTVIPLGISIREVYQTLKMNQIVAMVADQRGSREGEKVNFFGRNISVHTGPASLAMKTGAPILYGISVRQKDYSYETTFTEISKEGLSGSPEEKVKQLSQRHMSHLEEYVRKYPEQWLWMHKRWKH